MNDLERELRALTPRGPHVDLARMMYLAGRASLAPVSRSASKAILAPPVRAPWLWPLSTAITGTLAAWLAVMLVVVQYRSVGIERPTRAQAPHPPAMHLPSAPHVVPAAEAMTSQDAFSPSDQSYPVVANSDAHFLRAREAALQQDISRTTTHSELPRSAAMNSEANTFSALSRAYVGTSAPRPKVTTSGVWRLFGE
jgi:hypothetical protein